MRSSRRDCFRDFGGDGLWGGFSGGGRCGVRDHGVADWRRIYELFGCGFGGEEREERVGRWAVEAVL